MALKTYVLLPSMDVNAPVFVRVNADERVRIDKLPKWAPHLRVTFQDGKDNKNKTIRYKQTATSIYQSEQIKPDKDNIPANEPFTANERRAVEFRNGVLMTKDALLQDYLDAYPANELFDGLCPDVTVKAFREYKKNDELKINNLDFKLRTKAAMKIVELTLKEAQDMLIRLNGSFFEVPSVPSAITDEKEIEEATTQALIECQDMLVSFLDAAEIEGINAILQEEETVIDKTTIIVARLLAAGVISFTEGENQISRKGKGDAWVKMMDMQSDIEPSEKERLFVDFLNSEEGKVYLADLKKEVKKIDKA